MVPPGKKKKKNVARSVSDGDLSRLQASGCLFPIQFRKRILTTLENIVIDNEAKFLSHIRQCAEKNTALYEKGSPSFFPLDSQN